MALAHDHGHAADYRAAIEGQRAAKDAFFRSSPHSPLPVERRATFRRLDCFPVDEAYRFECLHLLPYAGDGPTAFALPTSDGQRREAIRSGSFVFEIGGLRQTLAAYDLGGSHDGSLFVPFLDATSGTDTYGAGRYLDLEPGPDGTYVLDFNLAYHPYCAYSPAFSCPMTPAENRLPLRIGAGERLPDPGAHDH